MKKTVVVGLSGGVDSSVSALLLKEMGHRVIALFMKNWEETDSQGVCLASREFEDVAAVCTHLEIPYYNVNFVKEYQKDVFERFLSDCKAGLTPNPDILCNKEIKFKALMKKALELGADFLATGHYCQTQKAACRPDAAFLEMAQESSLLLKGADPAKDQSYFLHAIDEAALRKTLFPVGHLCKPQVRAIARQAGLTTSEKKDSTGICFIGERNFKEFLKQFLGFQRGPFLTLNGKVVGHHDGTAYYTIGQRKGLGLGGEGDAWFVVKKDFNRNAVIVERGSLHPALYADELIANDACWISEPPIPIECSAKIRYRQQDAPCTVSRLTCGRLRVRFDLPQRAIAPGQSIVFYLGDICLGGAVIQEAGPSYYEMQKELPEKIKQTPAVASLEL